MTFQTAQPLLIINEQVLSIKESHINAPLCPQRGYWLCAVTSSRNLWNCGSRNTEIIWKTVDWGVLPGERLFLISDCQKKRQ